MAWDVARTSPGPGCGGADVALGGQATVSAVQETQALTVVLGGRRPQTAGIETGKPSAKVLIGEGGRGSWHQDWPPQAVHEGGDRLCEGERLWLEADGYGCRTSEVP